MGSIGVTRRSLRDELADLVGVRVGLSIGDQLCDEFIATVAPDMGPAPEDGVRMSTVDFQNAVFDALKAMGDPWTSMGPTPRLTAWRAMGCRDDLYAYAFESIHREVHHQGLGPAQAGREHDPSGCGISLDYREKLFLAAVVDGLARIADLSRIDEGALLGAALMDRGREARDACQTLLAAYRCDQKLDPWPLVHRAAAPDLLDLDDLFTKSSVTGPQQAFIDQRFIDYLAANVEQLGRIHWRQFERLTAEYLRRQGYYVELGPGSNDDGVDLRIWPIEPMGPRPPLVIVQCKRQRQKVEKVVVKALWSDMAAESAQRGLVATTSCVSRGANRTIQARGYGIDVADGSAILDWLVAMKTPGAGVSLL